MNVNESISERLNPYRFFLEKVKKGEINPKDVRIDLLIESFKVQAQLLETQKLYRESANFISSVSKLLRLKTDKSLDILFEYDKNKNKKIYASEVAEILKEYDRASLKEMLAKLKDEGLDFESYNPYKAGGKAGGKGRGKIVIPPIKNFQEFIEEEQPFETSDILFANTDYNSYAKEVYEKIINKTFKIKKFQDFIGLMFAILSYNLELTQEDIEKFLA